MARTDALVLGAGIVGRAHLLAQPGEVGRQDGWGHKQRAGHRNLHLAPYGTIA
jgi:hypothetical protein